MTSRPFAPFVSFRLSERGGGVRDFAALSEAGLLTSGRPIVFFVHGFNNDLRAASAAYARFLPLLGGVSAQIVGVYWPGDSWAGGANYMQALERVPAIGERFARLLHASALGSGRLDVSFVSHSLGGRLVLETLRALAGLVAHRPLASLAIHRVVFMAGAVPTALLELRRALHGVLRAFDARAMSLYSEADRVLQYAFPLGESLAADAFFPTALGRRRWGGAGALQPPMSQLENPRADHSDYWGSGSRNAASIEHAARAVRGFVPLGGMPAARTVASRSTTAGRVSGETREVSRREM